MIEVTEDYRRINRVITWKPVFISSEWVYLIERDNGQDVGVWGFQEYRDGYRFHAGMGEDCRGKDAIESLKRAIAWMFENTKASVIYALIPDNGKASRATAVVVIHAGLCYKNKVDGQRLFEVIKNG